MQTVLMTGGSGFISSNFSLKARKEQSFNVINLDTLTYAANPLTLTKLETDPGYQFVRGDIADFDHFSQLLVQYQPDAVSNFAAESHVDRSILNPGAFIQTNVVGTFQLLEASKLCWQPLPAAQEQTFRFLHVSTDEVYGSLERDEPAATYRRVDLACPWYSNSRDN